MRFADQVVLVTGAGRGIGRAIARRFAEEGASIGLIARSRDEIEGAAAEIVERGGRAVAAVTDVSDPVQAGSAVDQVTAALGPITVLVNNAGISRPMTFVEASLDHWDEVIRVNLYGAIHFSHLVARQMVTGGRGGAIVNVSSIHGYRVEPGSSHYDIAKGGMDQLTRALAAELAPHGIRVNGVAPGFVDTDMAIGSDGVNELDTPWFRTAYVERRKIPLARAAGPDEIAGPVLFLASTEASYVTGEIIVVDGGLSVTF